MTARASGSTWFDAGMAGHAFHVQFSQLWGTLMAVKYTHIGFRESRKSPDLYFKWRVNRSSGGVEEANRLLELRGKHVLDLGCGFGALSYLLLEKGARVSATEIDKDKLAFAKKKLSKHKAFKPRLVTGSKLPFPDKMFDMVFIFDVIEHVQNPQQTLREVWRTLKKGGYLYVEFTPYYSVVGHHLYDYAKWPVHILSEEKIRQMVFSRKIPGFMTQEYYWRQFKSLNKLKIGRFQNLVKRYDTVREKFIVKYPEVFEWNIPFFNYLGPLKDYFTMSFEGLYRKR